MNIYQTELEKSETLSNGLKVTKKISAFSGKPVLMMWKPKAQKPYINYRFDTEEQREKYLQDKIAEFDKSQAYKKETRERWKMDRESKFDSYKVGDMFYKSWGYSMCLVDFYQLISRTEKMGVFRELQSMIVSGDGNQGRCIPLKNKFKDDVLIKKNLGEFQKHDGNPHFFDRLD